MSADKGPLINLILAVCSHACNGVLCSTTARSLAVHELVGNCVGMLLGLIRGRLLEWTSPQFRQAKSYTQREDRFRLYLRATRGPKTLNPR